MARFQIGSCCKRFSGCSIDCACLVGPQVCKMRTDSLDYYHLRYNIDGTEKSVVAMLQLKMCCRQQQPIAGVCS